MQRPDPTPDAPTESQPPQRSRAWLWWTIGIIGGFFVLIFVIGALVGDSDADNAQASASSCPTAEEARYFGQMHDIYTDFGKTSAEFIKQNDRATDEPFLLFDEDWKRVMALVLVALQASADDIDAVRPPPSTASIHAQSQRFGQEIRDFTVLYASSIDALDPDTLRVALAKLESATAYAIQGTDEVERFCDNR